MNFLPVSKVISGTHYNAIKETKKEEENSKENIVP
jgi:hypothetical protein